MSLMKNLMETLLLSVATVALVCSPALAADLTVPMKAAPAAAPSAGWDGLYLGASVGYGWGTGDYNSGSSTSNLSGLFYGGQVGYNFQITDGVVAGVEGDLNWSNEKGPYVGNPKDTSSINWNGSVRGRLGMDAGQFLPYFEAGVAFANESEDYGGTPYKLSFVGWTAGAGVEFKLADQFSTNIEYRYTDYGSQDSGGFPVHLTDSTVRLGLNYHLMP